MAGKFFKLFSPEKKTPKTEGESEGGKEDFTPPLDGRRKLSISRSGRMRQANKKRHELALDLYGEDSQYEKPKHTEYHVKKKVVTEPRPASLDSHTTRTEQKGKEDTRDSVSERRSSVEIKTPEEEIESAFQIIDKIS